jgi:hypothetical protein
MQSVDASLAAGAAELAEHDKHVAEEVAATVAENVLIGQFVHEAVPSTSLYFPATH